MEGSAEPSGRDPPPHGKRTRLGLLLTTIYLVLVAGIAAYNWKVMIGLTPNEWGDYLAGVFGPLALIWLVLGFFQQGDELRYSAEALWLQGEELRNSVEQQRALVEATRYQVDFERENLEKQRTEFERQNQPIITLTLNGHSPTSNSRIQYHIDVSNMGEACTSISISSGDYTYFNKNILSRGELTHFLVFFQDHSDIIGKIFDVDYIDRLGQIRRIALVCDGLGFVDPTAEALAILDRPGGEEPREEDRL